MIIWYFIQDNVSQPRVFSCKHSHSPTSVSARLHAAQQSKTLLYQLLLAGKTVPRPAFIYRGSNKLIFLPSMLRCTPLVTCYLLLLIVRLISDVLWYDRLARTMHCTTLSPQPSSASPTNCQWIKNVSVAVKVQFKIRSLLAGYTGHWGWAATSHVFRRYILSLQATRGKNSHPSHTFLVLAEACECMILLINARLMIIGIREKNTRYI